MNLFDVVIIGAGAAGMFCAAEAAKKGRQVLLIDHAQKLGEKIRISGGGKCNFTNRQVAPENFISGNPRFPKHALYTFTPDHWMERMQAAGLSWFEKHRGQLFCEQGSQAVVDLLLQSCVAAGVVIWHPCTVQTIEKETDFILQTSKGSVRSGALVLATGGLAIPQIGATDQGLRWAEALGISATVTKPGLVPLRFSEPHLKALQSLAGLSMPVEVRCGKYHFSEDLLFTHKGLSGPAILQISSYWDESFALDINFLPTESAWQERLKSDRSGNRSLVTNYCAQNLPKRWVDTWFAHDPRLNLLQNYKMADLSNTHLTDLVQAVQNWQAKPCGSEGYKKAEVMVGGIATQELSPKTLQSHKVSGLFAIGEVVDVTGWLGGYNFQWAWSSAYICAQAL